MVVLARPVSMPPPKGAVPMSWHGQQVKATASKLGDGRVAVKLSPPFKNFTVPKAEASALFDEDSLKARVYNRS